LHAKYKKCPNYPLSNLSFVMLFADTKYYLLLDNAFLNAVVVSYGVVYIRTKTTPTDI